MATALPHAAKSPLGLPTIDDLRVLPASALRDLVGAYRRCQSRAAILNLLHICLFQTQYHTGDVRLVLDDVVALHPDWPELTIRVCDDCKIGRPQASVPAIQRLEQARLVWAAQSTNSR